MSGTGQFWIRWQETETGKRGRTAHPVSREFGSAFLDTINEVEAGAGDLDHWLDELTPAELAKYQALKTAGHL